MYCLLRYENVVFKYRKLVWGLKILLLLCSGIVYCLFSDMKKEVAGADGSAGAVAKAEPAVAKAEPAVARKSPMLPKGGNEFLYTESKKARQERERVGIKIVNRLKGTGWLD